MAGGVPSARRLARSRVPLHVLVRPRPRFAWTALLRGALFGCACSIVADGRRACCRKMFTTLWMWREEYQHHEQLPLAFNGTWPSWNSDLDNRPW